MIYKNCIYLYILFLWHQSLFAEVTVGFVGDIMLGRGVGETIAKTENFTYSWGNLLPLLEHTDFNVGNLETTLTNRGIAVPKKFNFRSDPKNVESLVRANFQIVNLANNHIFDYGKQGLLDTLQTLAKAHIKHVGAGLSIKQAQSPVFINKRGITIGFLGFTDNESDWLAGRNKSGTNYITIDEKNLNNIKNLIENVKKKVDFLAVSLHWGSNWETEPPKAFQKFARGLIDSGVDIIHGHSGHIFQGIEVYKNKLILYNTGDFLDDYAIDYKLRNDQSFFYIISLDKKGLKELRLIPVVIKNMQVNKAYNSEGRLMLQKMQKSSLEFGTIIPSNGVYEFQQIPD